MMTVDECVAKARKVVAAHTKAKLIEYAGLLVESGLPLDEVAAEVERSAATCAAALETQLKEFRAWLMRDGEKLHRVVDGSTNLGHRRGPTLAARAAIYLLRKLRKFGAPKWDAVAFAHDGKDAVVFAIVRGKGSVAARFTPPVGD